MKIQARNRGGVIHVQIGEKGNYTAADYYPGAGTVPLSNYTHSEPSLASSGRTYVKARVGEDGVYLLHGALVGVAKQPEPPKATAPAAAAPAKAKVPASVKAALAKISEAIGELADEDEDDE